MTKREWIEIGLAYLGIAFLYSGVLSDSPWFAALSIPVLLIAVISQQLRKKEQAND